MLCIAALGRNAAAAESPVPGPPLTGVVSSAAQLCTANSAGRLGRVAVRLKGVVVASDYEHGGLVLRDDTGFVRLEACFLNAFARAGQPVRLNDG